MIGKTIGNLRITSEIGKGGMGAVYLAEHVRLVGKKFAIKSLSSVLTQDPQFRERFHQEAQNQAQLDHHNIVQVTDFIEDNGEFFLIMEYVDGQSLSDKIKEKGKLEEKEALSIFKAVLEGLNFAHCKGIIHRDVKPSNILIDKSGRARITDFGIAILAGSERLTATGTAIGTSWYMSPEQIIHPRDIDHRSDVYSAGIVLYEMLTGDVPFDGETDYDIKNKQVNSPPPNPCHRNPEISEKLAQIILKALKKDPDDRFQGCAEFLDQIREYEKIPRPPPPVILLFLIIILLASGTGTYIYYQLNHTDNKPAATLIQTASDDLSIVCREIKEIELRRERLPIAKEHDTKVFEDLSRQISDQEQNVRDLSSSYEDKISQLAQLKKPVVDEEFEKYAQLLQAKKAFNKIHVTRSVKLHYKQYLGDKRAISSDTIRAACPMTTA
jgi:serine/threonine protein kinase